MKKQQILVYVGIAVLLLIIINWDKLMAFARNAKSKLPGAAAGGGTPPVKAGGGNVTGAAGPYNPTQLLSKGSTGPAVLQLQRLIIQGWGAQMLPRYGADGDFGPETEAALLSITGKASTTITTFTVQYYNKRMAAGGQGLPYGNPNYGTGAQPAWGTGSLFYYAN